MFFTSISKSIPEDKRYTTIALEYIKPDRKIILFGEDQSKIKIKLNENDKLIVYSVHKD